MEKSLTESNRDQKNVTSMLQAKVTFPIILRLKPLRAQCFCMSTPDRRFAISYS